MDRTSQNSQQQSHTSVSNLSQNQPQSVEEDKVHQERAVEEPVKQENKLVSSAGSDDEKDDSNSNASRHSSKSNLSKNQHVDDDPQNYEVKPKCNSQSEQDQDQLHSTDNKTVSSGQKESEPGKHKFKDDPSSADDQSPDPVAKQKQSSNIEESKEEGTSSESDDEQEEDEILANESSSSVIEVSPKGRFNRFNEELGRGAYKIVYRGVDTETGREIAWNVVNLRRLSKIDRIRIKSEIDLIKKLQHVNIIHFISAWINKQKDQVVFITEIITGGTLRKYVKKIKNIKLKVIKRWCHEILDGLVYLHEQKPHPIIHRDLKCDNIFINSNSGEIRIGDLGLSTPMQHSHSTSVLGTPEFMAPELYEECYGIGVDIYAFGMCVLEMITLERPYKECQNPAQIYNKVIQGIRPQALERIEDEEIKEFILLCLSKQDKRPTARDLLKTKFMSDMESEKNMQVVRVKPPSAKAKPLRRDSFMKQSIIKEVAEEENTDEDNEKNLEEDKQQIDKYEQTNIRESSISSSSVSSTKSEKKKSQTSESQSSQVITKTTNDGQTTNTDTVGTPNNSNTLTEQSKEILTPQFTNQGQVKEQKEYNLSKFNKDTPEEDNDDSANQLDNTDQNKAGDSGQDGQQDNQDSHRDANQLELEKQKKRMMKNKIRNQRLDESFSFLKQIDKEKHKKMKMNALDESDQQRDLDPQQQENFLDELKQDDNQKKNKRQQMQNNALMIEKNRNFKEDSHSTSQQNINGQSQQQLSQSQQSGKSQVFSKQQHVSNEKDQMKPGQAIHDNGSDLKRQGSKDMIIHPQNPQLKNYTKEQENQQKKPLQNGTKQQQQQQIQQHQVKQNQNQNQHQASHQQQQQHTLTHQELAKKSNHQTQIFHDNHSLANSNPASQLQEYHLKQSQSDDDEDRDQDVDRIVMDTPSSSQYQMKNNQQEDQYQRQQRTAPHQQNNEQFGHTQYDVVRQKTPQYIQQQLQGATLQQQQQKNFVQSNQQQIQNNSNFSNYPQQKGQNPSGAYQASTSSVSSPILNPNQQQKQLQQQQQLQFRPPNEDDHNQINQRQQQPQNQIKPNQIQGQQQTALQKQQAQHVPLQNQQAQKPQNEREQYNGQIPPNYQKAPGQGLKTGMPSYEQIDEPKKYNLGKIPMKFKIKSKDGSEQDVTFEFDTNGDTPHGVAQEMVKELQLPSNYVEQIAKYIQNEVEQNKPQNQPQKQNLQKQQSNSYQPPTKKVAKISKDSAFNSLKGLFEVIDGFYSGLQTKGIEFNEFVEALELSDDESQLKVEFLINLQNLKSNYKGKLENMKQQKILLKKKGQNTTESNQANVQQHQQLNNAGAQTAKAKNISSQQEIAQQQQIYQGQQHQNPKNTPSQNSTITPSQQTKKNGGQPHSNFATESQKQYQSFKIKREGSHNDIQSLNQQYDLDQQMHFQNFDQYFQQQSRGETPVQSNKDKMATQQQLKHISNANQVMFNKNIQLPIPQKMQTSLYKGNMSQSEDDVKILQNTLNIIYHISIMQQNPLEDVQNYSHQYLRVDGQFGDKTKNFVMKFQESAQLQVDGVVTDLLWKKLYHSYEKIQKEEMNKREKYQQTASYQSQQQQQQLQQKDLKQQQQHTQLNGKPGGYKEKSVTPTYSSNQYNSHLQQQHQSQQQIPPQQSSHQSNIQQLKISPGKNGGNSHNPSLRISRDVDYIDVGNDLNVDNYDDDDDSQNIQMIIEDHGNPIFGGSKQRGTTDSNNVYGQNPYNYQNHQQHNQDYDYDQDGNQYSN